MDLPEEAPLWVTVGFWEELQSKRGLPVLLGGAVDGILDLLGVSGGSRDEF